MAQHLSVRVPWHDDGWKGTVCLNPSTNMSCLRLKGIKDERNDTLECGLCGQCMAGHEQELPCIGEGAAFMSSEELHKVTVHPYKDKNPETHGHFLDTEILYPAYSFPAKPFAWLMTENIKTKAQLYGIDYKPELEPKLKFDTIWIQEAQNHKAIFDYFYQDVIPDESLCIAYAKQVPFSDDHRRVIIGMGHVKRIVPAAEHKHTNAGKLRSMVWETMICHSIRKNHKDGFVIPYKEMMDYAETHPDFDISSIIVYAPEDAFDEFSYATEHVSYDAVIDVILSCIKSFTIINSRLDKDYSNVIKWLNEQLAIVWEDRGAFPGLGAMLTAFGITLGIPMAREIKKNIKANDDLWLYVDSAISEPDKYLSTEVAATITPIIKTTWNTLKEERKQLFRLLSRFALNIDQARILFNDNERKRKFVNCSDKDIIENPYILYEAMRLKIDNLYISVQKVDRAVFPIASIAERYPVPKPSKLTSDNDKRRIRAMVVSALEEAANSGHTFLPCNILIDRVQNMTLEPACDVTPDMILAIEPFMKNEVIKREMADGTEYYKLKRLNDFDEVIEKRVTARLKANRLDVKADWRKKLDEEFSRFDKGKPISKEEELARNEKAAVLKVLAESRLSVLVGGAGTGKTTVLSILCKEEAISKHGVLLLAPTGKATVRLVEGVGKNFEAYNVAQFLTKMGRFDWYDMRYRLSNDFAHDIPETVIIDEASMLTEEMFGALLQTIAKAKRIIIVGDTNQLPPIGAGKPFVDLVNLLCEGLPDNYPLDKPKVANCYGELRITRRQQTKEEQRLDVELSKCFIRAYTHSDENIFSDIVMDKSNNVQIEKWESSEELEDKLLRIVSRELGMKNPDDQTGFDKAIGASIGKFETFFNKEGINCINKLQILAPVRNMPQGVMNINRLFHQKYRKRQIELSGRTGWDKRIPKAYGSEGIVYGDKVINVINSKKKAYAKPNVIDGYVANGEIGIACDCYSKKKPSNYLNVCFTSQTDRTYSYDYHDFNAETGEERLELAYALTVHKSQGSQFDTVILVLAEPCQIISRELLYTALTRQVDKIVILYNQDPYHLLKYSSELYSDIAKRFTDLFADYVSGNGKTHKPQVAEIKGKFYDEKLIYKTARGELVRSKSEVIIADALYENGLNYEYEPVVELANHKIKRPDFKIVNEDTGVTWYWEHCGMMSNPKYAKNWEQKAKEYKANGIEENKNLIVTKEYEGQGLSSQEIRKIIKEIF